MTIETVPFAETGTPDILELGAEVDLEAPDIRARVREALENGDMVFLPGRGFALTERERRIITDPKIMLRGDPERSKRNGRPTLTFNVATDRLQWPSIRAPERPEIVAMLRRYGVWSRALLQALAPDFAAVCEQNRIIYRPVGYSKTQGLHVDTTYRYPTQGRVKLRIFCNIDPEERPRVWQLGERFEHLARRYLPAVRGGRSWPATATEQLAGLIGFVEGRRTDYDHVLEDIRRLMKDDREYQASSPRRMVSFPPGSTWVALTDIVLHGAVSGQHSLDQVFFLPPSALSDPARSALGILERLCGRALA